MFSESSLSLRFSKVPNSELSKILVSLKLFGNVENLRLKMFTETIFPFSNEQCSAEKFHNWGQCPRALEKVGTFEKKVGTLWGK